VLEGAEAADGGVLAAQLGYWRRALAGLGAGTDIPVGAPAGISASFEYPEDLFDQATVQALAARLTRLYRTGDLARWNAAGELEYRGPCTAS
jgi:non-ribosomal peptide synthetase component F